MVNAQVAILLVMSILVSNSVTFDTALAAHDTVTVLEGNTTIVHVDHELRHGSINVNDMLTVRWYQPNKAIDLKEDPQFGSYQNVQLELFKRNNVLGASSTCSVEVFNAPPNKREGDMIYLSCDSFSAQSSPISSYGLALFTVRLDDTSGSAIDDDSLPSRLNLTEWTSAQASLWYSKSSGVPLLILGDFTSLKSSHNNSDTTSAPDSTTLSPPSEINVVSTSVDNIILSWIPVKGATGYNIYRSSSPDGPFDLINSSVVSRSRYSDVGLSAATTYYYKIATFDLVESDHSKVISVRTEEAVIPVPATPTPESTEEITKSLESPTLPSPSVSNPVPSGDKVIAASPTPPNSALTTNTVLLGSIVVPVAATAVVLIWKKGAFRGRARMETATEIEPENMAPISIEMKPENKDIDNKSPTIAEEPLLVTTPTAVAAQREKPDVWREFVASESEVEQTEVKAMPMLELKSEDEAGQTEMPMPELKSEPESEETEVKMMSMMEVKSMPEAQTAVPMLEPKSEVDTKLKEYFETVDRMQEAVTDDNYLYEVKKHADVGRKQKQKAKQNRRARKQKQKAKQNRRARKC